MGRKTIMDLWNFVIPRSLYASLPFECTALTRLLYYLFVVILGASFMNIIPIRNINKISEYGTRTLSVYIYHMLVRSIIYRLGVTEYLCTTLQGIIIYILLWIIVTIVLSTKLVSAPTDWIKKKCYEMQRV